jgi:hypothetical protein
MFALIRLSLFVVAAVLAIVVAIALVKLMLVLASLAIVALAGIFVYHFVRALYRRLTAARECRMIAGSTPNLR